MRRSRSEIDIRDLAQDIGDALDLRVEVGPEPVRLTVAKDLVGFALRSLIATVGENRPDPRAAGTDPAGPHDRGGLASGRPSFPSRANISNWRASCPSRSTVPCPTRGGSAFFWPRKSCGCITARSTPGLASKAPKFCFRCGACERRFGRTAA